MKKKLFIGFIALMAIIVGCDTTTTCQMNETYDGCDLVDIGNGQLMTLDNYEQAVIIQQGYQRALEDFASCQVIPYQLDNRTVGLQVKGCPDN